MRLRALRNSAPFPHPLRTQLGLESVAERVLVRRKSRDLDTLENRFVKFALGENVKRRYLRHSDDNVTEQYGLCPVETLAEALGALLGFEHPLVHGVDERRAATLRRLGLTDG